MTRLHETYEINDRHVIVRREDLRYGPPLPPHAKMSVLDLLCSAASVAGYKMIGCFGSKYSNWVVGLPYIADKYGLKSIICYPAKSILALPDWLKGINRQHFKLIHPNMLSINQSQAKKYIEEKKGYFIPFGFDYPEVVEHLAKKLKLPDYHLGTVIVPTGSGVTLASVLTSIKKHKSSVGKVVAVSSGRSIANIIKTVEKYEDCSNVQFVDDYVGKYANVPSIECPWNAHDHFELKAYHWLVRNIHDLGGPVYFINIGGNS